MKFMKRILTFFQKRLAFLYCLLIRNSQLRKLHNKQFIDVMFVLAEVPYWKSEGLYTSMKKHPRFNPYIVIIPVADNPDNQDEIMITMIDYCKKKGYNYTIEKDCNLYKKYKPDIMLYQKPYGGCYPKKLNWIYNLKALQIYVYYGCHIEYDRWALVQDLLSFSWHFYYENNECLEGIDYLYTKGKNVRITGLPIADEFLFSKHIDPWKDKTGKKRIIYAPHHTITGGCDGLVISTFLEYGEYMLELAKEYKDRVCFAFKPHPALFKNLVSFWGKERTDNYYKQWDELENCQVELGKYIDLFMTSDAMIHDCDSFIVEYHFTGNPVMFLVRKDVQRSNKLVTNAKKAMDLHYKGHSKEDIRLFINNLISDNDPMKDRRLAFYHSNMLPPNGKTASENIIETILLEIDK